MVNETQVIWTEFGERLRVFIARRVGSEADADDVLQEVFLRIHRYRGTIERDDRLVPWLFQVTRNAITDFYRAPERRRELPAGVAGDLEFDGSNAFAAPDEPDGPTSQTWMELAVCLRPMIDQLPSDYRDAVALVDLGGVPQREAAERAGLSVSGMKSRVQRGRQALKGILDDCCRLELDAGGRVTDYQPRDAACGPCADATDLGVGNPLPTPCYDK
jgi:RNA polymerase sigma-70 factor, ECF subfamily